MQHAHDTFIGLLDAVQWRCAGVAPVDEWFVDQAEGYIWQDVDQLESSAMALFTFSMHSMSLTRRFESKPEDGWSRIRNTFRVAAGIDCLIIQHHPELNAAPSEPLTGMRVYPE